MTDRPSERAHQDDGVLQALSVDSANPLAMEMIADPGNTISATAEEWEREFVSGLRAHIEIWKQKKRIDDETAEKALASLENEEALVYFNVWLKLLGLNLTLGSGPVDVMVGSVGGMKAVIFVEVIRMVMRNLIVQWKGKKMAMAHRHSLALWSMPVFIGLLTPLIFLVKNNPELVHCVYAYIRNKRLTEIIEALGDNRSLSIGDHIYLKLRGQPAKKESLAAYERARFEEVFKLPWPVVRAQELAEKWGPRIQALRKRVANLVSLKSRAR